VSSWRHSLSTAAAGVCTLAWIDKAS